MVGSVVELEGLGGAQNAHRFLQLVALFPAHAHRVFVNRGLHLQLRVLDDLDDLLGLLRLDALFQLDQEAHGAARALARVLLVEVLEAHLALDQLFFQHDQGGLAAIDRVGQDHHAFVVFLQRRLGVAKVEALADLLLSLQQRVAELCPIYLGDHVE